MDPVNHRFGARIIGFAVERHPLNAKEQILVVHYELDGASQTLKLEHAQAIHLLVGVDQVIQKLGRGNLVENLGPIVAGLKRPPGKRKQ